MEKVMILVPQKGGTSPAWNRALINLMKATEMEGYHVSTFWSTEFTIDMARTALVNQALAVGIDWIFFLDADVRCPALTIVDLINMSKKTGKMITSGVYYMAERPIKPVVFRFVDIEKRETLVLHPALIGKEPAFVDIVGLGCCLIKPELFSKITRPWFLFETGTEHKKYEAHTYGEDFYFFRKVKLELNKDNAEGMVAVDGTISCTHEKKIDITWQDYERSAVDTYNDIAQIAGDIYEFLGDSTGSKEQVYENIKAGMGNSNRLWAKLQPKTDAEIRDFYVGEPSKEYLPELAIFDAMTKPKRNEIVKSIVSKGGPYLDYGAGIGLTPMRLCKMVESHHADLPGYPFKFAQFRAKKYGNPINFLNVDDYPWNNEFEGYFNSITCTDVLEHLKDPREALDRLVALLKPEGMAILLIGQREYGGEAFQPHISEMEDSAIIKYLQEHGMSTANGTHYFKTKTVNGLLNQHWHHSGEY